LIRPRSSARLKDAAFVADLLITPERTVAELPQDEKTSAGMPGGGMADDKTEKARRSDLPAFPWREQASIDSAMCSFAASAPGVHPRRKAGWAGNKPPKSRIRFFFTLVSRPV